MRKKCFLAFFVPLWLAFLLLAQPAFAQEAVTPNAIATFDELMAHKVALKPELVGVHPRVFVTKSELDALRERTRTTHRADWIKATRNIVALKSAPPPAPGPHERRSQISIAFAITVMSQADAIGKKPEYLSA